MDEALQGLPDWAREQVVTYTRVYLGADVTARAAMRAAADAIDKEIDGALQGLPDWAREDVRAALRNPTAYECTELNLSGYHHTDDPITASAFDTARNPRNVRLQAIYGSDIGHFDVPDMRDVLHEAHECVERGVLGPSDFRDFVFENPSRFYTDSNPDFFAGTVVADAVAARTP